MWEVRALGFDSEDLEQFRAGRWLLTLGITPPSEPQSPHL